MSCDAIQLELCAYHFGTISEENRLELEAHLPTCAACTRAFVALKREIETAEHGQRPSPAARARLRRAVAEELGLAPRGWSWWERPLAFACAAAAVLLAMVMVGLLATGPGAAPHGSSSSREPAALSR